MSTDNNISHKNFDALAIYHPYLAPMLNSSSAADSAATHDDLLPGKPNVAEAHKERNPKLSRHETDIRAFMKEQEGISGKIICVQGLLGGDDCWRIINAYGRTNLIIFFTASANDFKAVLQCNDYVGIISHPRVRFAVSGYLDFYQILTSQEDKLFAMGGYVIYRNSASVASAPQWYRESLEIFHRFMNSRKILNNTLGKAGAVFFENRFKNFLAMVQGYPADVLKGRFLGVPAIIVAAGPSLSKNIAELKKGVGKALIIAADAAMGPLIQAGIVPHFVASVDRNDFTYEKLMPFIDALTDVNLVFVPEVTPRIPNHIKFRNRFYTYLGPFYKRLFDDILGRPALPLERAESVTHLALDVAQKIGCDPIVFMGLDLAFVSGRDHAEGTILHWGNRHESAGQPVVEGVDGQELLSSYGFISMLRTIESQLEKTSGRTYIDATEGGARINGTRLMSLRSVVSTFGARFDDMRQRSSVGELMHRPFHTIDEVLSNTIEKIGRLQKDIADYFRIAAEVDALIDKVTADSGPVERFSQLEQLVSAAGIMGNRLDNDPIIMALNDLIVAQHMGEFQRHKMLVLAAESEENQNDIILTNHQFVKFVQEIRKDALDVLCSRVTDLRETIQRCGPIQVALSGRVSSDEFFLQAAGWAYANDFLALASDCLDGMSKQSPDRCFYTGCIKIRQGDVPAGMASLQAAVDGDERFAQKKERFINSQEEEWLATRGGEALERIIEKRLIQLGPSNRVCEVIWPKQVAVIQSIIIKEHISKEELAQVKAILSDWSQAKNCPALWHCFHAICLKMEGSIGSAIAYLGAIIENNTSQEAAWVAQLARFLFEDGQVEAGFQRILEAVNIDPRMAVLWEEVGDTLLRSGDSSGAIIAYEKCLESLPDRRGVFRKIGDCYAASDRPEAAKVAYEIALRKGGGHKA